MRWPFGRVSSRGVRAFGELLHHPVWRADPGPGGAGADPPFAGDTVPTYPYPDTGSDPVALSPVPDVNPVLTAGDVTDFGAADAVADPFLFVTEAGDWHLFVEVFNYDREPTAAIGHATSPDGGRTWTYDRVVLRTEYHLSFPYVFRWRGATYMLPDPWSKRPPEDDAEADITLYRARSFPGDWEPVAAIVAPDRPMHDCVVFRWDGRWWALAGDGERLFAFHAAELETDGWHPHADNPVVAGRPTAARPAGRPVVREGSVLVFLQDCAGRYGKRVHAYRVTTLTPTAYRDRRVPESPVLEPTEDRFGWNSGAMHHVDPWYVGGRWRCAVDGNVAMLSELFGDMWAVGMYESR